MRIEALAIYSHAGERRDVRFGPGLNIVTGWSGTGKSSLLDIIEFCLGRTRPTYPAGVLPRAVSWFATVVEHEGTRLFVARPAPREGARSVQGAMVRVGVGLEDVDGAELETNTDAATVREQLTRLLGIPANEARAGTLMRSPLEAASSQALLLCFQAQGEIANKEQLFHRANDEEIRGAIRDTLPYFLGAVSVDAAMLRRELDEARRELRRAEARLERARVTAAGAVEGASALLAEASALGLAAPGGDVVTTLRELATAEPSVEPGAGGEVSAPLRARQRELTAQLAALQERLASLRRLTAERAEYGEEIGEQRRRLMSIEILPPGGDEEACPLCGQPLAEHHASVAAVRRTLAELDRRLEGMQRLEPRVANAAAELESAIATTRADLRAVTNDLTAVARAESDLAGARDLRERQAYLQGRITAFLATLPQSDDEVTRLERDVSATRTRADELEALVDPDNQRERTTSLLAVVAEDITSYARRLEVEHSEHSVRIDPSNLTLVADTREGPVELARMGSAANIIGYHVATHLALHKWFVEELRPVPHFVVFDQPSQAFYPDDVLSAADEELSDEDRARVAALYALIRDVVAGLDQRLQVIVCDHANLDLSWFQEAVVENWRGGEALVPQSWIE